MRTLTCLLAILLVAPPILSAQVYSVEYLPEPHPLGTTSAAAVNDTGRAVGCSMSGHGGQFAAVWQNGGVSLLADLGPDFACATDAGSGGRVAGYALDPGGRRRAVYWDQTTLVEELDDLGGGVAQANAVDAAGNLAGYSSATPGVYDYRACRWDAAGGPPQDLGALFAGWESAAHTLNAAGLVGGDSRPPGGLARAVVWPPQQAIVDLGAGFDESTITGVNEAGVAVGWGRSGPDTMAFTWDAANGRIDLPNPPGVTELTAHAINSSGLIAGATNSAAVVYRNGEWIELESLVPPFSVVRLYQALDVNADGAILCAGADFSGARAVLLHPAPQGLALGAPLPGRAGEVNRFGAAGASPGARLYLVYSLHTGTSRVPDCPGLRVELRNAQLADTAFADSAGRAVFQRNLPATAAGYTVLFQVVEPSTCRVSNVVEQAF